VLTREEVRLVLAQMNMIYTHVLNRGPLGVHSPLDIP